VANNNLNWQWVAGTGTDTNPHRVFNPTVQGTRFDPEGEYVRRYVPELRAVKGGAVHDPEPKVRRAYDYPEPIVDHREAIAEYKERKAGT
jgi:deoxyribodipyrimidine photo-lyase